MRNKVRLHHCSYIIQHILLNDNSCPIQRGRRWVVDIRSRFSANHGHIIIKHFNAKNRVHICTTMESEEGLQLRVYFTQIRLNLLVYKKKVLYQPGHGNVYVPPNIHIEVKVFSLRLLNSSNVWAVE